VEPAEPVVVPARRSKRLRPYEDLQHSQQAERVKVAQEGLRELSTRLRVPIELITSRKPVEAARVLHLSTADRKRMRSVETSIITNERRVAKTKEEWAELCDT
jgi:hypothetical protein